MTLITTTTAGDGQVNAVGFLMDDRRGRRFSVARVCVKERVQQIYQNM